MKANKLLLMLIILLISSACSKSGKVNRFLDEYENVVKKWEEKEKVESLSKYIDQISIENRELCEKSDGLKESFPVAKWDKLQVDRFLDIAKRFMFLRLKAGQLDRFPQPYDGIIKFSKPD
jgi:hypothetical protein